MPRPIFMWRCYVFSSGNMLSWFLFVVSWNMVFFFSLFTKCKVKFMFMNRILETRDICLRRSPVRAPKGQMNFFLRETLKNPTLLAEQTVLGFAVVSLEVDHQWDAFLRAGTEQIPSVFLSKIAASSRRQKRSLISGGLGQMWRYYQR